MLKKNQRLSKKQVSWLLRKGYKYSGDFFSIKFHLNKESFCRYSVVVSKKLLNLAVDRNLLRRQLYEILGGHHTDLHLDFVITAKSPLPALEFSRKKDVLLAALREISSKLT
jgi:ribonuclease P protein component